MEHTNFIGSWYIRPTPAEFEGRPDLKKTWTGPIQTEMYGKGLKDLCARTQDNLTRLSCEIQKMDPCLEYGVKHWHPTTRPKSADCRVQQVRSSGTWESLDVMFGDNRTREKLSSTAINDEMDAYVDPPAPGNKFCYFCSTMEEHQRHLMQQRKPKPRPKTAKPRVSYIAPKPKQKRKEEEEPLLLHERLYKVEVYTSDLANAGTNANVFISIKGSHDMLPRTQLTKKRGCAKLCFVRASKEVFHIKGPLLGNLQMLTLEHDGKDKSQGWHVERVEITDVKAVRTWVFNCKSWLSMYEKPHFSNKLDIKAEEKQHLPTVYSIEVHTGKAKLAGTDAKIFLTLFGEHGQTKKIHLVDPTSDKKLFERNSVDKFRIQSPNVGELKRLRIEHSGEGFGAGWFLDKIIVRDSERPKDTFYFTYGGWIAKDEGEGKLWRDIKAKKSLPKEIREENKGVKTKYHIMVKTGDVRYAGTDANVFIQMAGVKGITPKIKLDDAKNNFKRNMVDMFDVEEVNVGNLKHIVIGHDNTGPGPGWFLEKVEIKRYIPKEEARERLKHMKKNIKQKNLEKTRRRNKKDDDDEYSDRDLDEVQSTTSRRTESAERRKKEKKLQKASIDGSQKQKKEKSLKDKLFSVESSSDSSSSSDEEDGNKQKSQQKQQRPASALRRTGSRSEVRRSSSASDRGQVLRSSSSEIKVSRSASSLKRQEELEKEKKTGRRSEYEDDDKQKEVKVPLFEEYMFVCNRWFATDEDDGLCVRELPVTKKTTFYKT